MAPEPTRPLRILITNNTLNERSGSELYVRDLAIALVRRGHNPIAFSPDLGTVARELERATVPVIDDLSKLGEPPDIIHGQHHLETMTAVLRFPQTPAIFVCHGWLPWQENPPVFPSICRYVAVDDLCRERLLTTDGVELKKVSTIYNFADLDRFSPRSPLPRKPRSVLIFSNYASEVHEAIRAECRSAGIEKVEIAGSRSGRPAARPEEILPQYDIVFAKGRAAIEALATGCAVVVADYSRIAGMVTLSNLDELRRYNFGVRTLQQSLTRETVREALSAYDPDNVRKVSGVMRSTASLASAVDDYLDLYEEVRRSWPKNLDGSTPEASLVSASRYLHGLSPMIKQRHTCERKIRGLEADIGSLIAKVAGATTEVAGLQLKNANLAAELADIKRSRSWRAIQAYGRLRRKVWRA